MPDSATRLYAPPGDLVRLTSDEPLLHELAGRLWAPATGIPSAAPPIEIEIRASKEGSKSTRIFLEGVGAAGATAGGSPRGTAAADASFSYAFEEDLRWVHEPAEFRFEVPGALSATIDLAAARVRADVSPAVFHSKKSLSSASLSLHGFLARTLLEAPAAVLLGRRGWQVLHAGGVVGPRGAAVVRGAAGAGKSTLVAAAHRAGLGVLGDESLFVSRTDPNALSSSVRDLALREDSARLLGVLAETAPAFTGGERKCRIDLFAGSSPEARTARRRATVLLGPRDPGPVRLVPLAGPDFLAAFGLGEIPQERISGDPEAVARAWANEGGWLLTGASDVVGAVASLESLLA